MSELNLTGDAPKKGKRKPKPAEPAAPKTPRRTLIAQCCGALRGLRDEAARMKQICDSMTDRVTRSFGTKLLNHIEESKLHQQIHKLIAGYSAAEQLGEMGHEIEANLTQRECGKK